MRLSEIKRSKLKEKPLKRANNKKYMNKQNVLIGGVLIAVLFSVFSLYNSGNGTNGVDGKDGITVGSIAGPDVPGGYWNYNGYKNVFVSVPMATGTSTLCAIPVPIGKSRLIEFDANIVTPDGANAATFYIATSSTAWATTTNLYAGTLGGQATTTLTFLATTTEATLSKQTMSSPSYVVFDMKGQLTWGTRGRCYAEFKAFE